MTAQDLSHTLLNVFLSLSMVVMAARPNPYVKHGKADITANRMLYIYNLLSVLWMISDLGMSFAANPSIHAMTMHARDILILSLWLTSAVRMVSKPTMFMFGSMTVLSIGVFLKGSPYGSGWVIAAISLAFLLGNPRFYNRGIEDDQEQFHEEILNALEDNVAVLDTHGRIMAVCGPLKEKWKREGLPAELMKPETEECDVDTDEGTVRMMILRSDLIGKHGKCIGEIVIGHDISEQHDLRKEMDDESRKLMEALETLKSYGHIESALIAEKDKQTFIKNVETEVGTDMKRLLDVIGKLIANGGADSGDDSLENAIGMGRSTISRIRVTAHHLMDRVDEKGGTRSS